MTESGEREVRRTSFTLAEPAADGPSPLGWRGYGACTFCGSTDTVWQHDLATSRSHFRSMYGKGAVWGGAQVLCQPCEDHYDDGAYGVLASLQMEDPPTHEDELVDHLIGIAAFCRADQGPRALPEPDFPTGFEPLDTLTGAVGLIGVWPAGHRLSVAETRSPQIDDEPQARSWLVASPWPSLNLNDVFAVLWGWVELDADVSWELGLQRAAEAFAWTDAQALAFLRRSGS